ncbi:MAG: hypothetical protein CMH41_05785 [Micrococcales bacterium]|nr:hypothetical protein [Micrococcales bacterium]
MSLIDSLPGPLAERLSAAELPRPIYAVLGVAVLARSELRSPTDIQRVPTDLVTGVRGGVAAAVGTANSLVGKLTSAAGDMRGDAKTSYDGLVEEGHDAAVAYATERAVRSKVGKVEDKVAPRAGRAAARYVDLRRKWQEKPTVQRAKSAAERGRVAARRGATRFSEMNAPVMDETAGQPPNSDQAGS